MRWPFGPPHLTLKSSKKKNKKNKTNKKITNKKRKTDKETVKSTKIPKKELFSYQSKFSFFWGGVQKSPFLTTWPRKRAPQNTIKIGVSARHFWKNSYASRNGHFWTKSPNPEIPAIIFIGSFLLLQQQKTHTSAEPLFS